MFDMDKLSGLFAGLIKVLFGIPAMLLEMAGDASVSILSASDKTTFGVILEQLKTGITAFIPYIQGLAYTICALFFILSLIDLCMSERLTVESFIKHFTYLAAGVGIIFISPELFEGIIDFGNTFATLVADSFSIATQDASLTNVAIEQRIDDLTKEGTLMWIAMLLVGGAIGLPSILIAAALYIVTYVVSFSRIIELYVRGAFLPIGVALVSDDGMRGAGGRYLKKFIAVCCQSGVLVMIGKILTMMIQIVKGNMWTNMETAATTDTMAALSSFALDSISGFVILLGVGIAGVMALFKAMQLTNEIFGV